jgi:hypothetical protein
VDFSFSLTVRTTHGLVNQMYNFASSLEVWTRTPKYNKGKKKGRSVEIRPFLSNDLAALRAYGSMLGKVAVMVPVWDSIVSKTFVKLTLTRTGVIWSGHVRLTVTGLVETVKVPLPFLVVNGALPVTWVFCLCSPEGC